MNRIDLVFSELESNVCSGCTLVFDLSVDGKAPVEDTTGPTVTSVDPADSATGAAVTTIVTVSFSEPVDPNTVTSTTFTLTDGVANLAGVITVADDNLSATFDPDADLTNETAHTVTVTSGVTDTAGNALDPAFTSSFTTALPDTTGPTITGVDPTDSAIVVAVTTNVTVTFSEPVDPNSVTSTTFTLTNELANLAGVITVADDNLSATFDPDADLTNETAHTVTVTSGVTDTAGNALDPAFTSSFTTEAAGGDGGVSVDSIAPNAMDAGTTISDVTIKGSGFVDGADVTLENGNGPAPAASNVVVVDANTITLDFSAKSGGPSWDRVWDVRVTNLDGTSGVCGGCFTVHP